MKRSLLHRWIVPIACLILSGCDYDAPITAGPTRPVDARLLGDWVNLDKGDGKPMRMSVRKFDEFTYAVAVDGDIYRAFHSDFANVPFISVQDLNSSSRKYVFYTWQLSLEASQLTLRRVSTQVIPDSVKDSVALQKILTANAANPRLLDTGLQFARKVPAGH